MTETERYMKESLKPIFQQKFIKKRFLCCLNEYAFVVIKKKTLLIYKDEESYQTCPKMPELFFNLSFSTVLWDQTDSIKLSNGYNEMRLWHDDSEVLI